VREEREVCCDDLVAERCAEPLHYANALLALEQHRHELVSLALASHGGAFMKRIERLISGKPSGRNSWAAAAVGALAVSAALLVAAAPAWAAGKSLSIAWLPPALSPHRALIEEVAKERGVDPDLLALFVLVESSGDADALSPSGAKGLMQLMPKTAQKVALELRVPYSPERLADPRFNLELGAAYLASQLASFPPGPRQIELAAAAYNGGPKAARAFLEGKTPLSSETERYSNLVARLWSDRSTVSSANYDAWRAAAWGRRAAEAVAPVTAKPSLEFGAQKNPFDGQPYQHAGIDLPAAMGSPVVAPLDGVVTEVAQDELRGRVIVLRHGGGLETRFFHLGDVNVAVDQRVTRGEPIASIGVSGKTTGPHVHFEVRDLGVAVDPSSFLGNSK
jgi:murein DD-endopeptidase MepM/ murein hydrolase activator NlpD